MKPNIDDSKAGKTVLDVSLSFVVISMGTSIVLSFLLGRIVSDAIIGHNENMQIKADLRPFQLKDRKKPPNYESTDIYFDSLIPVSSFFLEVKEKVDERDENINSEEFCDHEDENSDEFCDREDEENNGTKRQRALASGQNFIVDIMHVDKSFLNSEERLVEALIQVVNKADLTLLSYHCHKYNGVACIGHLAESYIAFHTRPKYGAIHFDIFTGEADNFIPLFPTIEKLFVVPQVDDTIDKVKKPFVTWYQILRGGITRKQRGNDPLMYDIGYSFYTANPIVERKEVAIEETDFQRVDIVENLELGRVFYESYYRSFSDDGSYESIHPEFYQLERAVYLDGVLQSTRSGKEAYHEALVHPAMFAHSHPERVGIIGGGECATLREVLKHKTVEHVKMIEIDEKMVQISRKYLPDWSDCSDLEGSAKWCGDDDRAEINFEDALVWFSSRFGDSNIDSEDYKEDRFDVLIMDALDPEDDVPFAEILYKSIDFLKTLYNALNDDGMIVFQLGCSPDLDDLPQELTSDSKRAFLTDSLEGVGYKSIHIYEESHGGLGYPWSYLVAMKDVENAAAWNNNAAHISHFIHQRIIHTHSGTPALKHFDGSTMLMYQIPSIQFQAAYCKKTPTPESCLVKTTERRKNIPVSSLKVKNSTLTGAGRGVFTTVDIDEGSTIGRESTSKSVKFTPSIVEVMYDLIQFQPTLSSNLKKVQNYMEGYGWETIGLGKLAYFVESDILAFLNHGCDGTYNVDDEVSSDITEQNADDSLSEERDVHDPYLDRHYFHSATSVSFALRDIKAGEELFCNYLSYTQSKEWLMTDLQELKRVCNKETVGFISQTEQDSKFEV